MTCIKQQEEKNLKLKVPLLIQWLVTLYCNRKCRYCIRGAQYIADSVPPDMTISGDRILALFREAKEMGVQDIDLTGGEPFLREDMYQIITSLNQYQFRKIYVTTKYHFSKDEAQKLQETGIPEITVSFDTGNEDTQDYLMQEKGFFRASYNSISNLVNAGISITLQSVMNRYNIKELASMVTAGKEIGISSFHITLYRESIYATENLMPSYDDFMRLEDEIKDLQSRYDDLHIQYNDNPLWVNKEYHARHFNNCVIGRQGIVILPSGKVSKCLYGEIIFGDLNTQSLSEVWNSKELLELNDPPKEKFRGTLCYNCSKFFECNERGRCYIRSYRDNNC